MLHVLLKTMYSSVMICFTVCSCIRGLLEDRLVVLVTHQIQFALQADKILLIKNVSILCTSIHIRT